MPSNDLIFRDQRGHLVVLMHHVMQCIRGYRQITHDSPESAGVLIGERRGCHIIITDLSVPGADDIQSRFKVDRRGVHHQAKVNASFNQSGGIAQYIGEWHTHPEDCPIPSPTDRSSWANNLDARRPMVLLIAGRKSIWLAKKEQKTIVRMFR